MDSKTETSSKVWQYKSHCTQA